MAAVLAGNAAAAPDASTGPAAAAPDASKGTVAEIIVTGQKRSSTLQNTAASINVVTASRLEATGTNSTMQLQFATSGLNIAQDLGLATDIYIRGIGSNLQGIGTGNSVATYVDGVYLPNSIQAAQGFLDVDRVEVLKGPQATLYGRNATGGALLIVTAEPRMTYGAQGDVSFGNYEANAEHLRVDLPLVADHLSASVSLMNSDHSGYDRNLYTGVNLNYDYTSGVRFALRFQPDQNLDIVLRADYTHDTASDVYKLTPATASYYYNTTTSSLYYYNSAAPGVHYATLQSGNANPLLNTNSYACNCVLGTAYESNPRDVYYNINNRNPSQDFGGSATIKWTIPRIGTITSLTSERRFNAGPIYADNDNTPTSPVAYGIPLDTTGSVEGSSAFYHETFLSTAFHGPLNFVVGGNYFQDSENQSSILDKEFPFTLFAPNGLIQAYGFAKDSAWSTYIDGGYDFTSWLRLVAGVRYSSETKSLLYEPVPAPNVYNQKTYTSTNPRIGIEIRPQAGTLLYFTATSGFKSGGFNQTDPTDAFAPEKIWSYEAGVKTNAFDGRWRIAASTFYYDYTSIQVLQYLFSDQVNPPGLIQRITNGGSATVYGLDLDTDAQVTDRFTVGGGLELLHTAFGSAEFCDPLYSNCLSQSQLENVKGNPLPRAPEVSANFYTEYRVPVDIPGSLKVRLSGSYRGRTYYTVFQNNYYSTNNDFLLGANIRYDAPHLWYAEIYGNNLTNHPMITNMINSSPVFDSYTQDNVPGGTYNQKIFGSAAQFNRYVDPLTFGARVGFKF
jgi:iron complex outermembrane receptor protein